MERLRCAGIDVRKKTRSAGTHIVIFDNKTELPSTFSVTESSVLLGH